jgi:predicted PurR-regulated permease PerM
VRRLTGGDRPTTTSAIQQVQKAATELQKATTATPTTPPPLGVQRVQVETTPFNVSDYLMWGSISIAAAVDQLVLILFLSYFLLASGDLCRRKLESSGLAHQEANHAADPGGDRSPDRNIPDRRSLHEHHRRHLATWLAFRAIGVEQAAMWGILAGVFNSIPYFGPVLVTGGTALVAFMQFGTIHMAVVVSGISLAITSLEGLLLTPWLTSRASRMNAVAIFVGLLFWSWVWNVWGMLLAVPMLMVLKAIGDHVEDFKALGELLGE